MPEDVAVNGLISPCTGSLQYLVACGCGTEGLNLPARSARKPNRCAGYVFPEQWSGLGDMTVHPGASTRERSVIQNVPDQLWS